MFVEQTIEYELRGSGPPSRTYTSKIGYFHQRWKPVGSTATARVEILRPAGQAG